MALCSKAQLQQTLDPVASPFQRRNEFPASDAMMIDASGSGNAVLPPERLGPPAPCIVEVRRDHSDGALW